MSVAHSEAMALRLATTEDLAFITTIEREAAADRFVEGWSLSQHAAALADPDQQHLVVESVDAGGEPVGFILLAGINSPHRCIEFRRIVVGPKNRGLGRQAVRLLKRYAFGPLGAHRLWLDVKDFNARARALYLSEGFVEEGTLRDAVKSPDGYESVVLMSMLESEYERR